MDLGRKSFNFNCVASCALQGIHIVRTISGIKDATGLIMFQVFSLISKIDEISFDDSKEIPLSLVDDVS